MGNAEYMGTPELSAVPTSDKQTQTMKVFVLLCVVAAAMADADPYLVYSGYGGLHHGYAGYGYGYSAYPYTTYHYGKRSAEAEAKPEADPYLVYSGLHHGYAGYGYGGLYRPYSYGYGYGFPTTYHYGKRSAEAEPQYFYSGLHTPYLYGAGYTYGYPYATTYHYGKREAEAEPYYYGGYYGGYRAYRPYSYGYGRFG